MLGGEGGFLFLHLQIAGQLDFGSHHHGQANLFLGISTQHGVLAVLAGFDAGRKLGAGEFVILGALPGEGEGEGGGVQGGQAVEVAGDAAAHHQTAGQQGVRGGDLYVGHVHFQHVVHAGDVVRQLLEVFNSAGVIGHGDGGLLAGNGRSGDGEITAVFQGEGGAADIQAGVGFQFHHELGTQVVQQDAFQRQGAALLVGFGFVVFLDGGDLLLDLGHVQQGGIGQAGAALGGVHLLMLGGEGGFLFLHLQIAGQHHVRRGGHRQLDVLLLRFRSGGKQVVHAVGGLFALPGEFKGHFLAVQLGGGFEIALHIPVHSEGAAHAVAAAHLDAGDAQLQHLLGLVDNVLVQFGISGDVVAVVADGQGGLPCGGADGRDGEVIDVQEAVSVLGRRQVQALRSGQGDGKGAADAAGEGDVVVPAVRRGIIALDGGHLILDFGHVQGGQVVQLHAGLGGVHGGMLGIPGGSAGRGHQQVAGQHHFGLHLHGQGDGTGVHRVALGFVLHAGPQEGEQDAVIADRLLLLIVSGEGGQGTEGAAHRTGHAGITAGLGDFHIGCLQLHRIQHVIVHQLIQLAEIVQLIRAGQLDRHDIVAFAAFHGHGGAALNLKGRAGVGAVGEAEGILRIRQGNTGGVQFHHEGACHIAQGDFLHLLVAAKPIVDPFDLLFHRLGIQLRGDGHLVAGGH